MFFHYQILGASWGQSWCELLADTTTPLIRRAHLSALILGKYNLKELCQFLSTSQSNGRRKEKIFIYIIYYDQC